ncbi:hypothetical protein PG994_003444, partial [Apiospora phragmitis]
YRTGWSGAGAFPVALWGLEQYRDVAKRMGFWFQIRSDYQQSIQDLTYHRLSFEGNLKLLLLPLVDDDAKLEHMMVEPGGSTWKNVAIQEALEKRLQKSYASYLAILADMERVLEELNKELAIENDHVQSRVGGRREHEHTACIQVSPNVFQENRDFQLFRAKFSLGEEKRKVLFEKLETYNDRLEKLTTTSDAISQLQANRKATRSTVSAVNGALLKFWNHADKLYRIMVETWNCNHDQHCAQLILQHRTTADKEFRLGISSSGPKSTQARLLGYMRSQDQDARSPRAASVDSTNHRADNVRTKKAHASINTATVQNGPSGNTMTVTLPQKGKVTTVDAPSTSVAEEHIRSLCLTLAKADAPAHCLGYMEDDDIRYYLYPDDSCGPGKSEVQLSQILCGGGQAALDAKTAISFSTYPRIIVCAAERLALDAGLTGQGVAIEDHPSRTKFPPGDEQTKSAFDLIAAMQWMTEVNEEAVQYTQRLY